jgi:hypothetical protein
MLELDLALNLVDEWPNKAASSTILLWNVNSVTWISFGSLILSVLTREGTKYTFMPCLDSVFLRFGECELSYTNQLWLISSVSLMTVNEKKIYALASTWTTSQWLV